MKLVTNTARHERNRTIDVPGSHSAVDNIKGKMYDSSQSFVPHVGFKMSREQTVFEGKDAFETELKHELSQFPRVSHRWKYWDLKFWPRCNGQLVSITNYDFLDGNGWP